MADITTKFLRQVCVYWSAPSNDGYGGFTFGSPIEIPCRWTDSAQVVTARLSISPGHEIVSKSVVMVDRDIDELGMMWLGNLADLTAEQKANPGSIDRCYQVQRFDKIPMLKGSPFLRVAYL